MPNQWHRRFGLYVAFWNGAPWYIRHLTSSHCVLQYTTRICITIALTILCCDLVQDGFICILQGHLTDNWQNITIVNVMCVYIILGRLWREWNVPDHMMASNIDLPMFVFMGSLIERYILLPMGWFELESDCISLQWARAIHKPTDTYGGVPMTTSW